MHRTTLTLAAALLIQSAAAHGQELSGLAAAMAIEKAVVAAIARSERSVVAIAMFKAPSADDPFNNFRDGDTPELDAVPDAFATGVVIDRKGLILTTKHSLKSAEDFPQQYIRVAGKPLWIPVERVIGSDPFSDLAVLKVSETHLDTLKLQPIQMGDASKLKKGQIVITLGNPYAIARDGEVSASWGIVSNLRRRAPPKPSNSPQEARPTMHHFGTLIQTDAKLNLGTSGGPLLNVRGEMVGLTTSMAALVGFEKSAGYAIAVDDVFHRVLDTLKQGREVEYGFLGIGPGDLSQFERRKGQQGVRVMRVLPGTPASGLQQVHDVITHIGDKPLLTTADLMLTVGQHAPDSRILLKVLRFDRPLSVPVTLTKNRISGDRVVTAPKPAWRGLRVEYPSALRSLTFIEPIPSGCVIITGVEPESPADRAGLTPDKRIHSVENTAVSTPSEFAKAVADHKGPVRIVLTDDRLGLSTVIVQP
ncbi:MAG: trypsin-like peptidase domain-containing protein [Pirellulales bacterium]